jgi:hypothetical protein
MRRVQLIPGILLELKVRYPRSQIIRRGMLLGLNLFRVHRVDVLARQRESYKQRPNQRVESSESHGEPPTTYELRNCNPMGLIYNNSYSFRFRKRLLRGGSVLNFQPIFHAGSTFVLNPRRSSSFCLRGASMAGNSAACALGATSRSPARPSVAYLPG